MSHYMSARSHANCTKYTCVAYQINLAWYKTQHVDDCHCNDLTLSASDLDDILRLGSIPLLRIFKDERLEDIKVEIVKSQPESRYVAISHVWADGLGNPQTNALPRCQLRRLRKLLWNMRHLAGSNQTQGGLLLWCDTLCCPVGPPDAKNRALAQMRRVYEEASQVLVLDISLSLYESQNMSPEEACARIMLSGWMRRLWTLQEGALPAGRK